MEYVGEEVPFAESGFAFLLGGRPDQTTDPHAPRQDLRGEPNDDGSMRPIQAVRDPQDRRQPGDRAAVGGRELGEGTMGGLGQGPLVIPGDRCDDPLRLRGKGEVAG